MLYRNRWFAGAVLVAVLSFFGTCNYIDHLRARAIKAEDRADLAEAKEAGLNEALMAKPKEVIKTVTLTKEVVKLVKEGKVQPVAAAHVESPVKEVPVPTCPPLKSEGDSFNSGTPLKAESLGVQTGFDLFIGVAGQAQPVWTGKVKTTLTAPGYRQEVSWTDEELKEGAKVVFSEEIAKALQAQASREGWFKRHFKVACPGFAVQYGLAHQQFDYGPTCGAAFVW